LGLLAMLLYWSSLTSEKSNPQPRVNASCYAQLEKSILETKGENQ